MTDEINEYKQLEGVTKYLDSVNNYLHMIDDSESKIKKEAKELNDFLNDLDKQYHNYETYGIDYKKNTKPQEVTLYTLDCLDKGFDNFSEGCAIFDKKINGSLDEMRDLQSSIKRNMGKFISQGFQEEIKTINEKINSKIVFYSKKSDEFEPIKNGREDLVAYIKHVKQRDAKLQTELAGKKKRIFGKEL